MADKSGINDSILVVSGLIDENELKLRVDGEASLCHDVGCSLVMLGGGEVL